MFLQSYAFDGTILNTLHVSCVSFSDNIFGSKNKMIFRICVWIISMICAVNNIKFMNKIKLKHKTSDIMFDSSEKDRSKTENDKMENI